MKIIHLTIFCLLTNFGFSKSVLEQNCESLNKSFYYGHSCFVQSSDKVNYSAAVCKDIENGHLAFILTNKTRMVIEQKRAEGVIAGTQYIGLEQVDTNMEPDKGWAWIHPDGRQWIVPEAQMIFWSPDQPDDNGDNGADIAAMTNLGMFDATGNVPYYALCQYDEPRTRIFRNYMKDKKGHNSTIIKEINSKSVYQCARRVITEMVASSFSYNENTRHCIVHWTDGRLAGYEPVDEPGYNFWHLDY